MKRSDLPFLGENVKEKLQRRKRMNERESLLDLLIHDLKSTVSIATASVAESPPQSGSV